MLKVLAIAVYTIMTMMLYESIGYKTDSRRRKQALAIVQLFTIAVMLVMAIYLVKLLVGENNQINKAKWESNPIYPSPCFYRQSGGNFTNTPHFVNAQVTHEWGVVERR